MAEGMPKPRKPQSTYDTLRNRGRDLDEQIDEAAGDKPPSKAAEPAKKEGVGMPKPSLLTRVLKVVTGK
jgi:hypothetical protein